MHRCNRAKRDGSGMAEVGCNREMTAGASLERALMEAAIAASDGVAAGRGLAAAKAVGVVASSALRQADRRYRSACPGDPCRWRPVPQCSLPAVVPHGRLPSLYSQYNDSRTVAVTRATRSLSRSLSMRLDAPLAYHPFHCRKKIIPGLYS